MMRRRFRAPVRRSGDGFVVDLGADEAGLVRRLVAEVRELLSDPDPDGEARVLLHRLFPVVHTADPEAEAEYQRLMREELVASKLAAFDVVDAALAGDGRLDDAGLVAFMQSVNSVRLVLGSMLGVTDDSDTEIDPEREDTAEYQLYGFLSWLLEWSVQATR